MDRCVPLVLALALGLGACSEPRPSATVRLPSDPPPAVVVRNVAVLDVGSGRRTPGRDVLLAKGLIAAMGPSGSVQAPEGAREISGKGATLAPGLVDMHGHIVASSAPTWVSGFRDPEANLRDYLYAGVTTLFDPSDGSGDAFTRRARVASGELLGPRIFTTGPLLTPHGGHPVALVDVFAPWWIAWYVRPQVGVQVDSVEEIQDAVDALAADEADAVKIVVDRIPLDAPLMSRPQIGQVILRARTHDLRVVAHIGTVDDAFETGDAGVALWMHGVYKEPIPDEKVAVLAGFGIPMVVTIEVFDRYARAADEGPWQATRLERETVPQEVLDSFYPVPEDFDVGPLQSWLELTQRTRQVRIDNARKMHEAGVTILAGSDTQSGVFPGAGLHRELRQLVRAGLTPAEAIRAATLDPARWLANGEEPDFGSVEVGKRADLILVDGDPTRDVSALEDLREVFLGGVPLVRAPIAAP